MNKNHRISALLMALLLLMGLSVSAQATAGEDALVAWAKEQAEPLLSEMMELAGDENYLTMSAGMPGTADVIRGWHAQLLMGKPVVRVYDVPTVEDILRTQGDKEPFSLYRGLGDAAKRRMDKGIPQLLVNLAGQMGEVAEIVATSLVNDSVALACPEGFRPLLLIYQYEEAVVMVSFMEQNHGVLAQAVFVPAKLVEVLDSFGS
ncbi:MAG: hypothetical protein GX653_07795 [Clostridiales bacterium]|nr:hypothetical protein [Clostridiales bacterium]